MMQDRQELNEVVAFLQTTGISQAELAEKAKVSQATVSRAMGGRPQRHGSAREKLFTFIHQWTPQPRSASASPHAVFDAVEQVWDGSPEHATALARVIKATAGLAPIHRSPEDTP